MKISNDNFSSVSKYFKQVLDANRVDDFWDFCEDENSFPVIGNVENDVKGKEKDWADFGLFFGSLLTFKSV